MQILQSTNGGLLMSDQPQPVGGNIMLDEKEAICQRRMVQEDADVVMMLWMMEHRENLKFLHHLKEDQLNKDILKVECLGRCVVN